jgi:hypothetical protein
MTYINNKLPMWLTKRLEDANGDVWYGSFFDSNHPTDHFEKRKNSKGDPLNAFIVISRWTSAGISLLSFVLRK